MAGRGCWLVALLTVPVLVDQGVTSGLEAGTRPLGSSPQGRALFPIHASMQTRLGTGGHELVTYWEYLWGWVILLPWHGLLGRGCQL